MNKCYLVFKRMRGVAVGDREGASRPVAVVTGASQGLGLALAEALARDGWRLVIDARHPPGRIAE